MKKVIVILISGTFVCFSAKAQCDKTLKLTSSKTEFVDSLNNVEKSMDETVEVTLNKTDVTIIPHGSDDEAMKGSVQNYVCDWKGNDKGSIHFNADLADKSGDIKRATVSINAESGKTIMLLDAKGFPSRIRLTISSVKAE